MTEQTFTLPAVPPSVNNLFVTAGNRRVKSKTYAAWMQAARWQIAAQRPRLMLGAVAVEIECQRPTKSSDLDSRTKAALDAPFAEAKPGTLADLVSALNAADPAPTPVPVLEPAPIAPQADTIESATA